MKRNKDGIYPLRGWAKFFHRLGRLLLFPLRRPLLTIFILAVLFLAPTFRGVKPANVFQWYGEKIEELYDKVLVWWGVKQPEVYPGELRYRQAYPDDIVAKQAPEYTEQMEDEEAPNILDVLRGTFGLKKEEGDQVFEENNTEQTSEIITKETPSEDIEEKESSVTAKITEPEVTLTPEVVVAKTPGEAKIEEIQKTIRIPKDASRYAYPASKKVYSLEYLDYPHELVGKTKVHNANEIEINGQFVLLYGVYVHPLTVQGGKATAYLKDLIEGKEVTCGVVAYTEQNIATGICYYDDISKYVRLPQCVYDGLNYSEYFDKENNILKIKNVPKINLRIDRVLNCELAHKYKIKSGEIRPMLDWISYK